MATIIPALKGTLGNTTFYQTTMKVSDLVRTVRPPNDLEEWAGFSIEERLQRDPDLKRIKNELAPYIANSPDRFFGSIIVLVYRGELTFEALSAFAKGIPAGYKSGIDSMGFVTIDGVTLVVLDGQHRWRALHQIAQGEVQGDAASTVPNDDVCVILIQHETPVKTRRIFNVVNRYAKQTSRGDNIITSEDDGYAIVARALMHDDEVFGRRPVGAEKKDFVEWRSNTLAKRSLAFTTISAVYESVKLVLAHDGVEPLDEQRRPDKKDLERYGEIVQSFWETIMSKVEPYQRAAADMTKMPDLRKDDQPTSLLFKPAGQIALVDGMIRAAKEAGLSVEDAAERLNQIPDWSMTNPLWQNIIIKSGGTIDAGADARRRTAALIAYLVGADHLDAAYKLSVWRTYNEARRKGIVDGWIASGFADEGRPEDLPKPVVGEAFTAADARAMLESQSIEPLAA